MSEINNNSQYNYNISLDPPIDPKGEVEEAKKGKITFTDKLTGATMVLSATFDKLGKMTIYMDSENPNLPTPPLTSVQINSALKPGDVAGRGNPFLGPIPFVQVQIALLELHSIMRVSNLAMAAFENSCMDLTMSLARTEADLIISAADKEAKMMIMEMVAAGFALVGAVIQFGGAVKGLTSAAKAKMNKTSTDLDDAKAAGKESGTLDRLDTANAQLKTKQDNLAKFDAADQKLADATSARETTLKNKNQAQKDLHELQETSKGSRTKEQHESINKKQAELDKLDMADLEASNKVKNAQKDLDKLKGDLGLENSAKTGENGPRKQLQDDIKAQQDQVAKAELDAKPYKEKIHEKQTDYNNAQQDYTAQSQLETALFTAGSQISAQLGIIIKNLVNSILTGQKAQDEADQKITGAMRENLNRLMERLSSSMQKGGDIMNSLIQALEKLANEHVNASSMNRN